MRRQLVLAAAFLVFAGVSLPAQRVSLFNRLGSTFLSQSAEPGAVPDFGNLYNWVVGSYEGRKFSLYGRLQVALESSDGWEDDVRFGIRADNSRPGTSFLEFSGAFRPVDFLEIALGNGYGTNNRMPLPWADYQLPGGYGYATELSYGLRKYASDNGLTLLFRGDGAGLEGLTLGWNVLPIGAIVGQNGDAWRNSVGLNYTIAEAVTLSFGGRFTTELSASQVVGVYGELVAVRGLKVNAGVTMTTESARTSLGSNDASAAHRKSFTAVVNAGAQYTITGLRMTVAFDGGILAGPQRLAGPADASAMPVLAGVMLRWTFLPPLTTIIQVRYGDNLASSQAARESKLTVTPRLLYRAGRAGTFCLTPVVTVSRKAGVQRLGYDLGLYWQYNFSGNPPAF